MSLYGPWIDYYILLCSCTARNSQNKLRAQAKLLYFSKGTLLQNESFLELKQLPITIMPEVKLIGAWPSPYSYRVIWALKLKHVEYDYVQEDLSSKSSLLLSSNPVYKKTPVLVHNGKSISESMIILEYIDQTWPENHPLLPKDPFGRYVARFWAKFVDENSFISKLLHSVGIDQEKAVEESLKTIQFIDEHGLGEGKFLGGNTVGLADLALGGIAHWLNVIEEVVGLKLLQSHTFPRLFQWVDNFKEVPAIKDNLPNRDELLVIFKQRRDLIVLASQ